MQRAVILLMCLFYTANIQGQSLKKYAIGSSGCSAYFFCDPGEFSLQKSEDSSDVYTGECKSDNVTYGIICVKLKDAITDMPTSEDVLAQYMDYLKGAMKIAKSGNPGKGQKLKNLENTRGIVDYWTGADNTNWKVKGWTNGAYIAVLYASAAGDLPESKVNIFLEGLLFPGM